MALDTLYRNPDHPASFGGINSLYRALDGKIKYKDIKTWLESKDSYSLHKPLRYKFTRNRVIVGGIDEQFQADLVDLQSLVKYNDGYKYLLTCIDVFSKYAWAIPLKSKSAGNVKMAFQKIFSERKPQSLQTDKGSEFTSKTVQNFLKKEKIHFFTTNNETKASIVERFHRTLKTKMWKYFTEFRTYKYINVIDSLVYSYNHTWHRSIKMEPASVNLDNQAQVWRNLYGDIGKSTEAIPTFKTGDTVRISKLKRHFEKSYENNWTREIFTVHEIIPRQPVVYKLKDLSGELIDGTFYASEMQKVADSGFYPVEKVLKKRKVNGKVE